MSKRFAGYLLIGVVIAFVFGPDGPLGGLWRPEPSSFEPGALLPGWGAHGASHRHFGENNIGRCSPSSGSSTWA